MKRGCVGTMVPGGNVVDAVTATLLRPSHDWGSVGDVVGVVSIERHRVGEVPGLVPEDAEVQVGASGYASAALDADDISSMHVLANLDANASHVAIERPEVMAMADDD